MRFALCAQCLCGASASHDIGAENTEKGEKGMEIVVRKPTRDELDKLGAEGWPIWECEPSTFDWEYDDRETCYILEGDVTVKTDKGDGRFGAGDRVVFPQGLKCGWSVAKTVRTHDKVG